MIGTVEGDLDDTSKNLVIVMLEGFEVIELGVNVGTEKSADVITGYGCIFSLCRRC